MVKKSPLPGEYQVRNRPHSPTPKGIAPREGGKFYPWMFESNDSLSSANMFTPSVYRETWGGPSPSASVIDSTIPVEGMRLRRDYTQGTLGKKQNEAQKSGICEIFGLLTLGKWGCGCIIL